MLKKAACIWVLSLIFGYGFAQRPMIYAHESVQRGALLFLNHCSGCHALRYVRYQSMVDDLGLTSLRKHVINKQDVMLPALTQDQSLRWFGRVPPDLSLVAREKGHAWLWAYLTGFYPDAHQRFGVNNHVIPGVAMPNVFASMSQEDTRQVVKDVIAFLDYAAEPSRGFRYVVGCGVMLFLSLLLVVFYSLWARYNV